MKILYKLFFALTLIISLGSCSNYLDVVPDNIATIDYAFRNRNVAEKYLFTYYSYKPMIGSLGGEPSLNGSDETWVHYGNNFGYLNSDIARGYQNSSYPIMNYWDGNSGLWTGIHDCNIFLENVDKVTDLGGTEKARWIAEVKFLKAYYHYYLLKAYGPIPIVDVNLPVSASVSEVQVYREPIDEVVTYITNLMAEAAKDLPLAKDVIIGKEGGRIDQLVALSMRAEVFLFAASPLFNGNTDYAGMVDNRGKQLFPQTYDANKWKLAADACKEAIDACTAQGKALYNVIDPMVTLAPDFFKLQTTIRQAVCEPYSSELIWGNSFYANYDLARASQPRIVLTKAEAEREARADWAPTIKTAERYYSANGVPIDEDTAWINNNWYSNRYKIRPAPSSGSEIYQVKKGESTVYLHYNREPRFYASLGFDKGIYFGNSYTDFPTTVKYCEFFAKAMGGRRSQTNYSITGYSAKKMHSFKNTLVNDGLTNIIYFPFPVIRLADLYLMYAEALNEADGSKDEAISYLDLIRTRAGLKGVKESWLAYSNKPDKPNTKEGLRQIIHQERGIELALEGKRFWDIRRWKEIDVLNVQPLGWNSLGETAEDFYKVVPIAQIPVKFTVKDYFWPIRDYNLTVNKNLLQNYGW